MLISVWITVLCSSDLAGVDFAMLTLAFAQVSWSIVFQGSEVTNGDDGLLGIWPSAWASGIVAFFYVALAVAAAGIFVIRHVVFAPFGYGLRATRDSLLRSAAIGIDAKRQQLVAFVFAGAMAGLAGGLFAFSKGSIFPDAMSIPRSLDRKSTRLNSSHSCAPRMPPSA